MRRTIASLVLKQPHGPPRRNHGQANLLRSLTTSSGSSEAPPLERTHEDGLLAPPWDGRRQPVTPYPLSPTRLVPSSIVRPPYAETGRVPLSRFPEQILLHDDTSADRMRQAARLARRMLDFACARAHVGVTTDDIDAAVHEAILQEGAYPSPLNYAGFPKSLCSSINEVICHGIPDMRPLELGDVVSFDVSCFVGGVHGDNCATVIVGDSDDVVQDPSSSKHAAVDWRGVPYRTVFDTPEDEEHFVKARRLVAATHESLMAAIEACRPGGCLSHIGHAISDVAEAHGFSSVEKYRGHGICDEFHCAPFVKHFRNEDKCELVPGMIFTIEPMLVEGPTGDCFEWSDDWTVSTVDGGLAAQFEHEVLITADGVEILTLPN